MMALKKDDLVHLLKLSPNSGNVLVTRNGKNAHQAVLTYPMSSSV